MKMTDFNWNGLPTAILQLQHSKLNTKVKLKNNENTSQWVKLLRLVNNYFIIVIFELQPLETRFGSRTKPKHTLLMQEKKNQCTQEHTRLLAWDQQPFTWLVYHLKIIMDIVILVKYSNLQLEEQVRMINTKSHNFINNNKSLLRKYIII